MKPTHNAAPADPMLLGWRPAPQPQPVAPAAVEASPALIAASEAPALPPAAVPPNPSDLERLRVVELSRLARAAGLPQLARSGRRAQLLEALAGAPC